MPNAVSDTMLLSGIYRMILVCHQLRHSGLLTVRMWRSYLCPIHLCGRDYLSL